MLCSPLRAGPGQIFYPCGWFAKEVGGEAGRKMPLALVPPMGSGLLAVSPLALQQEVLTPPSWTPPLTWSWSPAGLTSGMAPRWGLGAAGTAQITATVSCGFGLCPQHQPLPAGWSLTPRGSHRWGTFFPAVPLEPPPAAPSSLPLSSRCPKEERSGVLGPWEDKGLTEALRPGCGGGEGCRAE